MEMPKAPEYLKYLYDYANESGIMDKIRFNTAVTSIVVDHKTGIWTLTSVNNG